MFLILQSMQIRVRCGRERLRREVRVLVMSKIMECRITHRVPGLVHVGV